MPTRRSSTRRYCGAELAERSPRSRGVARHSSSAWLAHRPINHATMLGGSPRCSTRCSARSTTPPTGCTGCRAARDAVLDLPRAADGARAVGPAINVRIAPAGDTIRSPIPSGSPSSAARSRPSHRSRSGRAGVAAARIARASCSSVTSSIALGSRRSVLATVSGRAHAAAGLKMCRSTGTSPAQGR